MPSINKIITLVFISTLLPYSPISDAVTTPYNHEGLSREYITDRKKYWQITDKNPNHRLLDLNDWMQTINYMEGIHPPSDQYPIKVYLEAPAPLPRPEFSYTSTAPIFGTGLLPAYYFFDLSAIAGFFKIHPVHMVIIDSGPISTYTESWFNGHQFNEGAGPYSGYSHAEEMAKILFSPNTVESDPERSTGQIGAIPRQLTLNENFIKSSAFASVQSVYGPDGKHLGDENTWRIPVNLNSAVTHLSKL